MIEIYLNKAYTLQQVTKAFFNHRIKWDKDTIKEHSIKPTSHKNVDLISSIYKGKGGTCEKAFLDKRILWAEGDETVYAYMTRNSLYKEDVGEDTL